MARVPTSPTPSEAEDHFRELLRDAGLADPDEVRHDSRAREITFLWREPKLAVVLELDDGVDSLRLDRAEDPVYHLAQM